MVNQIRLQRRPAVSLTALCLIWSVAAAAGACMDLSPDCVNVFLTGLQKSWYGRATYTPVGPRPYDITFRRNPQGQVEGTAHPGDNSTHYWRFYQEDQALKLRFLSTFAGNTQPLFLIAREIAKNTWIFESAQPQFLEVHVKPRLYTLELEILLHGKRHVVIELKNQPPTR